MFDSIMIAPNTFGVVMGTPLINRVVLRLVRQDPTLVLIANHLIINCIGNSYPEEFNQQPGPVLLMSVGPT